MLAYVRAVARWKRARGVDSRNINPCMRAPTPTLSIYWNRMKKLPRWRTIRSLFELIFHRQLFKHLFSQLRVEKCWNQFSFSLLQALICYSGGGWEWMGEVGLRIHKSENCSLKTRNFARFEFRVIFQSFSIKRISLQGKETPTGMRWTSESTIREAK